MIAWPTLMRGLREELGSWKTICARARSCSISRAEKLVMSLPRYSTRPEVGSDEAEQQPPRGRLSRAALPREAEHLPFLDGEAHPVHRVHCLSLRGEKTSKIVPRRGKFFTRSVAETSTAITCLFSCATVPVDLSPYSQQAAACAGACSRSRRRLLAADGHDLRAAGRESAARRRGDQVGRAARHGHQLLLVEEDVRHAVDEALRVGVQRAARISPRVGRDLHHAPRVHDGDPVGDLRDEAEVVRDEDDRELVELAQGARSSVNPASTITSREVVGSSAIRMSGFMIRASPIMILWRMPPESWWGYSFRRFFSMPSVSQDLFHGGQRRVLLHGGVVKMDGLQEMPLHGEQRVQRGERVLEDHGDSLPAHAAGAHGCPWPGCRCRGT